ncbi:hypothetical protein [Myxococcus virescens]|uniref:Uncharacterized protein n=1 Tax=Myxococcus virescens TaxID=83456 RepID=A0A511H437_9BACT|nr:hypothetical protein [Myxococcus virescens]GEL68283.1 hypothetical protein MVI01_00670 [Myxococcus virescens]SDE97554.1 hypothetical protein SAMN04488504_11634 [Myxococcus virescens]
MSAERRVRQVKLAAASTALVRRGAVLLEDALRTASLPDAPGGRVLVIRQLSLGTIHADRSPATLSLVVEQRVRELARLAVHARSQSAVTAQAVYFRDELEPFVLLATRLAQGLPLDAWFWRLAVPGLHPGMSRDDMLRLALASALRTEPGHAAAMTLVSELHALGALAPLLGALRWQDGPALARSWWGHLPSRPAPRLPPDDVGPTEQVAEPLRSTLARWARTWGAGDARALWLASVALCTRIPSRVASPDLPSRAWRVLGALQDSPTAHLPTPREPLEQAPSKPDAPTAPTDAGMVAGIAASSPPSVRALSSAPSSDKVTKPLDAIPASPAGVTAAPQARVRPGPADIDEAPGDIGATPQDTLPRYATEESLPTVAGGLLFLLPMLNALGLEEFLAGHPALADLGIPERFLRHVAERLGVPSTDPLFRVLQEATAGPLPEPSPFVLPVRFQAGAGARAPFRLVRESTGRCVAFDARARLPLASTSRGEALPPPFDRCLTTPLAHRLPWNDATLMLRAALLAVGRVTRRLAHMGLRELVLRPGHLVATRTHLDIVFAASLADIRIRRAGLDINPGWVPWLARVIQYHYQYDETGA